jgi:hypothetical protein
MVAGLEVVQRTVELPVKNMYERVHDHFLKLWSPESDRKEKINVFFQQTCALRLIMKENKKDKKQISRENRRKKTE